jgi:hypothetical protein
MTDPPSRFELAALAAPALLCGPVAALLHETDLVALGPSATLWPLGVVAAAK